jgi:hypothetical protein
MPTDPSDAPTRGPARTGPYVISGILLVLGIAFPLIVPIYASDAPRLAGMPFFYWFQMLLVPIEAAMIGLCYRVLTVEDRRRREVLKTNGDGAAAVDDGGGRL